MLTNYHGELELNLKAFGRYMTKKLWIVLVATVFWGIVWLMIARAAYVPMYESSSRMFIKGNSETTEESSDTLGIYTNYFIEMATSGPVINGIIKDLKLDTDYTGLMECVGIYKTSGVNTINITVRQKNAQDAQKIVCKIQEDAMELLRESFADAELVVIEEPYLSVQPVAQNHDSMVMYGAFGACVITLAVIVFCFLFDGSLKDEEDVKKCLNEEVLAVIPEQKKGKKAIPEKEAYRLLRTNLSYMQDAPKTVCVVSCDEAEKKSNTAYELACAFAENGSRVLLLDGDLRASSLRQRFSRNKVQMGLTEILSGKYDAKKINCQTEVKNLEMLLSGNPAKDSTELLDSDCFKEFLKEVKKVYDVIILDTPSMKDSIDAAVAARQCEGTLIVIAAEKTKNQEAKDIKLQIEKIGGRILGCAVIKQC